MIPIEDNQNNENNPNVVKDKAKQIVKKMAKRIGRKLLVILLPITIVLVLISAITWFVFMDEGTWNDKEKGNPSTYTKNVKISPTDGITTDKMEIIKEALFVMGYTTERIESMNEAEIIKILQLSQKLNRVITKIDDCTVGELLWCVNNEYSKYLKKPEDLEYLLNAEVVTQYPNIDGLSEDKLNGIIKFARLGDNSDTNGDGVVNIYDIVDIESIRNREDIVNIQDAKEKNRKLKEEINKQIEASSFVLKYISESEFDTKFNNYINTGNKEVFKYFTIDDQENVIIATWGEEHGEFSSNNTALQNRKKIKAGHTESTIQSEYDSRYKVTASSTDNISAEYITYTATKTPINYKAYVQKYTLPFEYLWSLLVMGESDDFVLSLAELAYESQMVVGIYDSITTTVDVKTHNYTENFRKRFEEKDESGSIISSTEWTNPPEAYSYFETNTITTKYDDIQFGVMYANVWVVEVIANSKRVPTSDKLLPIETTEPDEEWSDNGTKTIPQKHVDIDRDPETKEIISKTTYYTYETYFKEKKTTGQLYKTTQDKYYEKYENVETKVKEKTDIDPNTDLNFVKLLRADQNANALLFKPINVVWLCDMLSQNADTVNMVELTEYLINKAKNPDDTSLTFNFNIFGENSFSAVGGGGNLSAFGTTLSKEKFIEIAKSYRNDIDYTTYIVPYLEDFYDICSQYNVNPVLALAHACLETGYGSSSACQNNKNYFGMAHYNDSSSGKVYSSVSDSIEDYCKWVLNNATVGTSAYSANYSRAQEYATVNDKLQGTPDTNIYVLYCRYAYLGDIHYCDEPDFSNPAGEEYYKANGSDWGKGGRIYIYTMYEKGGIYTGEYENRCGHSNASDPTSLEERADYAVYSTNSRINVAKSIFGQNAFVQNFSGESVTAAGYTFPHYLQRNYSGSYGTSTISKAGCGPTSLAMVLAGLKNDYSITPQTVVENIKDYWPDGSYYVTNQGSSHCIFSNAFLQKYYGVSSEVSYPSESNAIQELENGNALIGSEEGHILAIVPVPDEFKQQGYKFYIMDSARGHDGPYKSIADANRVVRGSFRFIAIIKP